MRIFNHFETQGAPLGGPGAYFQDFLDFFDFGDVSGTKMVVPFDPYFFSKIENRPLQGSDRFSIIGDEKHRPKAYF